MKVRHAFYVKLENFREIERWQKVLLLLSFEDEYCQPASNISFLLFYNNYILFRFESIVIVLQIYVKQEC